MNDAYLKASTNAAIPAAPRTLRDDLQDVGKTIEACLGHARDFRVRLFGHRPEPAEAPAPAPREDSMESDIRCLAEFANELLTVLNALERIG